MRVVFLVPRRADHGQRDATWAWVRHQYEQMGWPIREGHHDDGPFNCSAAFARAADCEWDVAITTASDCYVAPVQLRAAVALACDTGKLVRAFDRFYYLSEEGTAEVLKGYEADFADLALWSDDIGSGPAAITRELWDRVGGRDQRFKGWGYEDVAFRAACDALAGEDRVPGPNFHLWHPESPEREETPELAANRLLYLEYLDAAKDGRMTEYLASR